MFLRLVQAETRLQWVEEQMGGEKVEAEQVMVLMKNMAMKEGAVYFGAERGVVFRSMIMQHIGTKIEIIQ